MATTAYFYVKSNDGSTTLFTSSARFGPDATATVTETGITFSNGEVYTYSGSKKFVGVASSANATVPDFSFGDTFLPYSHVNLYIIDEEPTPEYTLLIDGVEVTDYENVIINGVSYKCKQVSVPTDLTGYTVTVPAGWTASAGYGQFSISCSINWSSYTGSYNYTVRVLCIGYEGLLNNMGIWYSSALANSITFDGNGSANINNTNEIILSNISGTDVTNQTLIQWFVDNNATFEKESA